MAAATIKFHKHYVTDGVIKARVQYSAGRVYCTPADVAAGQNGNTREAVTLYAKDHASGRALASMLAGSYQNDTDSQTDHFDTGRVRLYPGQPLYAAALARCAA